MSKIVRSVDETNIPQNIISKCIWSDTYTSLKHILQRTANQFPLLISFLDNNNNDQQAKTDNYRTILFFHRNLSNKLLLTPLQQCEDPSDKLIVHPQHCSFAMPDLFKGIFEFVRHGQRCSRIFSNLAQLTSFASNFNHSIVFMSRDPAIGYFQDSNFSQWSSKTYSQGAIFRAERIHHSSVLTNDFARTSNDYLECTDEDGYIVFIKMDQTGRYSIIATSIEEQENQPEIYLHSSQTRNIAHLIKRVTIYYDRKNYNNCIRLVRGSVPHDFHCQYFYFIRQHAYDTLVGLTQEGLVIEWNLDSNVPCRYAINLTDVLDSKSGILIAQAFESYIEQARTHYKENFQYNMQLVSSHDWGAFKQYWKWTSKNPQQTEDGNNVTYQSRHHFHIVASIQDLSDNSEELDTSFRKRDNSSHVKYLLNETDSTQNKSTLPSKAHSIFSQMSQLMLSPSNRQSHGNNRSSRRTLRPTSFILLNATKPFDDSIYESNQSQHSTTKEA